MFSANDIFPTLCFSFIMFTCTLRFLITWILLTFLACVIYTVVVFGSLVNKKIVPNNNVPKTIPYITIPSVYNSFLNFSSTPTVENKTFTGSVEMKFVARDLTQKLFLHRGQNLKINNITLEDIANGTSSIPALGAYDKSTEVQAYLPIQNLTTDGEYILSLEFEGTIGTVSNGPFHLSYVTNTSETRYALIFGHSIDTVDGLRYLIPCLDSQEYPAIFNFNFQHSNNFRAISNFVARTQRGTQLTRTLFNATFELTSSEMAFALIDVNLTPEIVVQNNLTINKYFRKDAINTISTERILQFMAPKTTDIGKLDVLSLPNLETIQQAGISFLNEQDVISENIDLGLINS